MNLLKELLEKIPSGKISDGTGIDQALASSWHQFKGHADGGMEGYKLLNRMEKIEWKPPILKFTLERHGGLVQGSTRAELQHWEVNVDERTAGIVKEGHRQLKPMASRISVKSIAAEIVELIISGKSDVRIRRLDDGSAKIVLAKIFPYGTGFNGTVQSRRKRFLHYVQEQLAQKGWISTGENVFRPQT